MNKHKCTIEFELETDSPIDPNFEKMMGYIFSDWNDGRRPFSVEMIVRGLRNCIEASMLHCCEKTAQDRYGNEMVETKNSTTAKWVIESGKEWDKQRKRLPTFASGLKFSL